MIDHFSIGLTHVLMLILAWKMIRMPEVNVDPDVEKHNNKREV